MGSHAQRIKSSTSSSGTRAFMQSSGGGSMKRQKTWEDAGEQVASKKRFVGVRQRPSGRWVAEIKDTTQKIRLWLGTFDSAEEGAKAYDSAARALRGANTRTNFVTALSCETPSASSKATRLIRLRQIAAANAKLAEAEKLGHGAVAPHDVLLRHDVNPQPTCSNSDERRIVDEQRHSEVSTPPPLFISCSSLKPGRREIALSGGGPPPAHADSEHIPSLPEPVSSSPHEDLSRVAINHTEAAESPPPPLTSPSSENCCNSTSEAVAPTIIATAISDPPLLETSAISALSCSSESSSLHSCASSGASSSDQVDAIPWPDYVLVDGLDLPSCETHCGFAAAFDFSAEAMDRDSCTSLLEDHSQLRDSDVDSTEFPNFAMSSASSDMDRVDVGDGEICSSHDQLVWIKCT